MDHLKRSLAFKLTLAFLLVGLTGAGLVALVVRQFTQQEFNRLVLGQNQEALLAVLLDYYRENGNWVGVDRFFAPGRGMMQNNDNHSFMMEARRSLFAIADLQGNIIFGGNAKNGVEYKRGKLTLRELGKAQPLEVDGETVGYLVYLPSVERWQPDTLEGNFLFRVNRAILLSALFAAGFAVALGGFLAYTLTKSLRELTAATQALKSGKLGHQVEVRSQDELGILAESFNQMSAELARSTEIRRQMTANIAHDLRSPLSIILGYTEALSDGKLNPDADVLSVMHAEARHLNHLIDDLKTISLADAGELPLMQQNVAPGILLQRTADAHRIQADRKGISLRTDIPENLPEIRADVERMIQVLGNLMGNALRFTPAGGEICLSARFISGAVHLSVADTGTGIPPEELPFIFERTFRGDKARQQLESETGLGLAIAKSLVETQGGKISAQSQPGQGTVVTIEFPV